MHLSGKEFVVNVLCVNTSNFWFQYWKSHFYHQFLIIRTGDYYFYRRILDPELFPTSRSVRAFACLGKRTLLVSLSIIITFCAKLYRSVLIRKLNEKTEWNRFSELFCFCFFFECCSFLFFFSSLLLFMSSLFYF